MAISTVVVRVPEEVYNRLVEVAVKYEIPLTHTWTFIETRYKQKIAELETEVKNLQGTSSPSRSETKPPKKSAPKALTEKQARSLLHGGGKGQDRVLDRIYSRGYVIARGSDWWDRKGAVNLLYGTGLTGQGEIIDLLYANGYVIRKR